MATYPTSVFSPATKNSGDTIQASHVTDLDNEVVAMQNEIVTTGLTNTLLVNAGVKFPATQAASSDVHTLDDYEEGTFTPGVSFGGATTGITYTTQSGGYVKIGTYVFVHGYIVLSSKGSATGTARLTGLPFTSASGSGNFAVMNAGYFANMDSLADTLNGLIDLNSTTVALLTGGAAGAANLSDANFTNTSEFAFSLAYRANG